MIILAHLTVSDPDAQPLFDGLWRFARDHTSDIGSRLMDWRLPDAGGNASAFDADCDMAYGLLPVDARWGSCRAIDYRAAVATLIAGITSSTLGPQSRLPLLGDWVVANGTKHNQYSPRSSDFMRGHFRALRRASIDSVWGGVLASCGEVIERLQANYSPATGLLPDFAESTSTPGRSPKPAAAYLLEGPHDGAYRDNAGRAP